MGQTPRIGAAKPEPDAKRPGTNLNPGSQYLRGDVQEAHQRLYGRGAKLSGTYRDYNGIARADEQAEQRRPKAAEHGKDIDLPMQAAREEGRKAALRKRLG